MDAKERAQLLDRIEDALERATFATDVEIAEQWLDLGAAWQDYLDDLDEGPPSAQKPHIVIRSHD